MIFIKRYNKNKSKEIKLLIDLSFFSESEEKTEKPTPKKKKKARQEGQVVKSQEINTAIFFIIIFFSFSIFIPKMFNKIKNIYYYSFEHILYNKLDITTEYMGKFIIYLFKQIILISMPVFIISNLVLILLNIFQVGWNPTLKPIKPKFSRISPMKGIKKLVSFNSILELIKSLLKFSIISFVIYKFLLSEVEKVSNIVYLPILNSSILIGKIIVKLGMIVGGWFILVAILDFSYQKFKHNKSLKMTKQELKEEYKQSEGNPQIKGRIKQKMREASMRRMMQDVPKADVIITNPTHYSIAILYDNKINKAPKVIAKGKDYLALRIRKIAKENKVEIVENKEIARTLYASVDVGKEIPPELYKAVAEILAFVYKMKNKI